MSNLTKKAAIFAKQAHEGQVRKYTGEPYFNHCAAVAALVKKAGGDDEQIAAAFLHDTIEDCGVTWQMLVNDFGHDVADLVVDLSDRYTHEAYPELNRKARKEKEIERLGQISERAKLVKCCDLADNTGSIVQHDPGFASVYLIEKAKTLQAMGYKYDE